MGIFTLKKLRLHQRRSVSFTLFPVLPFNPKLRERKREKMSLLISKQRSENLIKVVPMMRWTEIKLEKKR